MRLAKVEPTGDGVFMKRPYQNILSRFESSIVPLVPRGAHLGLALSGGPDSFAMAELTLRLQPRYQWQLLVVHVNHKLRQQESEQHQALVEAWCQQRQIPCFIQSSPLPRRRNLEAQAREQRLQIFLQLRQQHHLDRLLLAHHADDQVELFFMRLAQGAGSGALAGMRPLRDDFFARPMLAFRKEELSQFCQTHNIAFGQDSSNNSQLHWRNQFRHQLLPALYRLAPAAATQILTTMQSLGEEAAYLESQAAQALLRATISSAPGQLTLDVAALQTTAVALQPRLWQLAVSSLQADLILSRRQRQSLQQLCASRAGCQQLHLKQSMYAYRDYGQLLLQNQQRQATRIYQTIDLKRKSRSFRCGVWQASISQTRQKGRSRDNVVASVELARQSLPAQLIVRSPQPGDRLRQASGQHKKLQDYFTDNKISKLHRSQSLVVEANQRLVALLVPLKIKGGTFVDRDYIVDARTSACVRIVMQGS